MLNLKINYGDFFLNNFYKNKQSLSEFRPATKKVPNNIILADMLINLASQSVKLREMFNVFTCKENMRFIIENKNYSTLLQYIYTGWHTVTETAVYLSSRHKNWYE